MRSEKIHRIQEERLGPVAESDHAPLTLEPFERALDGDVPALGADLASTRLGPTTPRPHQRLRRP
jgi:hypothetical protein